MSGVVNAVKKVWNAVAPILKVVAEVVIVAVAIYFTAGLALSYFPATAGFAAALPGFAGGGVLGLGIGEGAVAGTGILSSLAADIGMGGGLAAGAAADTGVTGAAAAGLSAEATAAADAASSGAVASTSAGATAGAEAAGAGSGATVGSGVSAATTAAAPGAAGGAAGAAGGGAGGAAAAAGKMSLADKFLIASTVSNVASGLTAPSPADIARARAGFYGSYYGKDNSGGGSAAAPEALDANAQPVNKYGNTTSSATPTPGGGAPVNPMVPAPSVTGAGTGGAAVQPGVTPNPYANGAVPNPLTYNGAPTSGYAAPTLIPQQAQASANQATNTAQIENNQTPQLIPRYV